MTSPTVLSCDLSGVDMLTVPRGFNRAGGARSDQEPLADLTDCSSRSRVVSMTPVGMRVRMPGSGCSWDG
jgi:hypothetical protein